MINNIKKKYFCVHCVQIYDGLSTNDPLVGTYCGLDYPPEVVSTSNFLYVHFYSDGSVVAAGFNATYTQQDGKALRIICCPYTDNK